MQRSQAKKENKGTHQGQCPSSLPVLSEEVKLRVKQRHQNQPKKPMNEFSLQKNLHQIMIHASYNPNMTKL